MLGSKHKRSHSQGNYNSFNNSYGKSKKMKTQVYHWNDSSDDDADFGGRYKKNKHNQRSKSTNVVSHKPIISQGSDTCAFETMTDEQANRLMAVQKVSKTDQI